MLLKNFVFILFLILLPTFIYTQNDVFNILNFGAKGDGKFLNTTVIQKAIDEVNSNGGGTLIIPQGIFLTGAIELKSNVKIEMEENSILKGSPNPSHYYKLNRWKALILADSSVNISIRGKGTIDGNGKILALKIDSLFYQGAIDSSNYELKEKRPKVTIRPQIIEFVNSTDIVIEGITLKHAASWVQSYYMCKNLKINKITVDSDTYWNNDGIDIIDCKNVEITNSYFNASDDGICLKSYGRKRHGSPICDSIYISNCKVRSSASAVKLGTSSFGGFQNIEIKNIEVFDTYRSAIALESYGNGFLRNVLVENIKAKNTGNAFFIRIGKAKDYMDAGILENVVIKNMDVEIAADIPDKNYSIRGPALPFFHNTFPSSITGLKEQKASNIKLENINISYPGGGNSAYANLPTYRLNDVAELASTYPEFSMFGELPAWGIYCRHVKDLDIKNLKLSIQETDYRPAIVFDDVIDYRFENLTIEGPTSVENVYINDSIEKNHKSSSRDADK